MTFGEALTIAMKERGTNANRIANASGVSRFYISKLVNGEIKDPTWAKACAIIQALDMKPSEFEELTKGEYIYAVVDISNKDEGDVQ